MRGMARRDGSTTTGNGCDGLLPRRGTNAASSYRLEMEAPLPVLRNPRFAIRIEGGIGAISGDSDSLRVCQKARNAAVDEYDGVVETDPKRGS